MLRKKELIEQLNEKGYTKKDAKIIINDVFEIISAALIEGESVQIHGFGTFEVKEFASRETVDLKSGNRITIPPYKAPKFTAGKFLKHAVKDGILRE